MEFKIGVITDSFRVGVREGIEKARKIGADGIQMYATYGEMAPENLSAAGRKELLDFIRSNGLVVSALCGDLGFGFADRERNKGLIERTKMIMDLAKDLETSVITTHIGVVPEDKNDPRWAAMQEACEALGEYGESIGAYLAIETGPERSELLKRFLDSLGTKGIKVNLDPANLVMVVGDDPVEAVRNLKDYIIHTHAKDGIMLKKVDAEKIYGALDEMLSSGIPFKEVPLGEGGVNFPEYLKALNSIGYNGFLTIEREVGEDPEKDIRAAVKFLKDIIAELNR